MSFDPGFLFMYDGWLQCVMCSVGELCGGTDVSGCVVEVVAGLEGSSNISVITSFAELGIYAVKTAAFGRCRVLPRATR